MNLPAIAVLAVLATAGPADANTPADANAPRDLVAELLDMPAPGRDWKDVAPHWSPKNQPPDDAPLEVLLAYWQGDYYTEQEGYAFAPPNAKVQARLLDAVIEKPERLFSLRRCLPETPKALARLKELCDKLGREEAKRPPDLCATVPGDMDQVRRCYYALRAWLMVRSPYYRDELIGRAKEMAGFAKPGARRNIFESDTLSPLPILARLDWKAAEKVLNMHADGNSPEYAFEAMEILYRHALDTGNRTRAEAFRRRLRKVTEDPRAEDDARDRAIKALVQPTWPGRDEWFASLFASAVWNSDALAVAMYLDPNGLIPVVAKRVDNKDHCTRFNAIESLLPPERGDLFGARDWDYPDTPPAEALKPLLPWLTDPNWWSDERSRARLISGLADVDLPESIPGLLWVLRNDPDCRPWAAVALGRQKFKQAGPELWKLYEQGALSQGSPYLTMPSRRETVGAMLACGAIPDERFTRAIETYIRTAMAEPNSLPARRNAQPLPPLPVRPGYAWPPRRENSEEADEEPSDLSPKQRLALLGGELLANLPEQPGPAGLLLARAKALRDKEPRIAQAMLVALVDWDSPDYDLELTRLLAKGVDTPTILCALTRAGRMRKNAAKELAALVARGGPAAGVAATVLADANTSRAMLRGDDRSAKLTLLASARLNRTPLRVDDVAAIWDPDDKLLARAYERYLESEDSPAARKVIWGRHRGRPPILGARWSFAPKTNFWRRFARKEKQLARRMRAKDAPDEIIAFLGTFRGSPTLEYIIECRAGRRTISVQHSYYGKWSREMTDEEFGPLTALLDRYDFENLPPLTDQDVDGSVYEYIHLTRRSGVRVYMENPGSGQSPGTPYHLLDQFFMGLDRPPETGDKRP